MSADTEVGGDPVRDPVPESSVPVRAWERVGRPSRPRTDDSRLRSRLRRASLGVLLVGTDLTAFGVGLALTGTAATDNSGRVWAAVMVLLFWIRGCYRTRLTYSLLDDVPALAGRCVVAGAIAVTLVMPDWATDVGESGRRALLVVAAVLTARGLTYTAVRALRRSRLVGHRTLIIGAGEIGSQIARTAVEHPEFGLTPVGFVDARPMLPDHALAVAVIGGTEDLGRIIQDYDIEYVIVAFTQERESSAVGLIRTCDRLDCEMFFVPRLFELAAVDSRTEDLLGLPLVRLRRAAFRTVGWAFKRAFDLIVAISAMAVLALPMAAIACSLRVAHGRGVIYRQVRLGLDGHSFRLAKFRTLRTEDAEDGDTRWSIQHDERLDRLSRFLRRWSLDELPQLLNILRGDMSLVGPRPERPHFAEQFTAAFPRYVARHRVPCGLTGWAQIHGLRGDTSIEERVRFDNYYIENWSLWLDIKILLRTAMAFRNGG